MNWHTATPQEFLEWLSIEGIDGAHKVHREYDQLPWHLRIAFWVYTSALDPDRERWIHDLFPNLDFDENYDFRDTMESSCYAYKEDHKANLAHRWLSGMQNIFLDNEPPPDKLILMARGFVPEKEIQREFELYKPAAEIPGYTPATRGEDTYPPIFWETFWETHAHNGSRSTWLHMANRARHTWPKPALEFLARALILDRDISPWVIRRLINLGNIPMDKPLIKLMMTSQSKQIRLLASKSLSIMRTPKP